MKKLQEQIQVLAPDQNEENRLAETIKKLPYANKIAIELHFKNNLSRNQIATQLNWSVSKVNQKITRGITLLKMELNREYFREAEMIMEHTAQRLLSR